VRSDQSGIRLPPSPKLSPEDVFMPFATKLSQAEAPMKRYRMFHPLVAVLVVSSALVAFGPTASAQVAAPIEIGSGSLKNDRVDNQHWQRFDFVPLVSGTHTIRVTLNSNADVRFSLFEGESRTRFATTKDTATALRWTGNLDGSKTYAVGVWTVSGSADFTATIESGRPAEPDNDNNNDDTGLSVVQAWSTNGEVYRVKTVGDSVYVGGDFTEISGPGGETLPRTDLAAFNRFTGKPTNFAPVLDGDVRTFATSPDDRTLYVGGAFRNADGQSRERVAAFDVRTGALTDFNPPKLNQALRAITVTDTKVYLGGLFTKVGTENKQYVAAFDPDTSALDSSFTAAPNDAVRGLVAGPEGLWIGGDFFRINGAKQRGLGLVDLVDGSLQPSDDVTAEVIDLVGSSEQLFAAIGGPGGRAAAFDRTTGKEQWTIKSDGNFQGVDVDEGRYVYFGGHYEIVEGNRDADRLTRHDKLTGEMDVSWFPQINGYRSVNTVDVTPDGLYIGGDFTKVDRQPQAGFAILSGATE